VAGATVAQRQCDDGSIITVVGTCPTPAASGKFAPPPSSSSP
jgi:hypothetical protein